MSLAIDRPAVPSRMVAATFGVLDRQLHGRGSGGKSHRLHVVAQVAVRIAPAVEHPGLGGGVQQVWSLKHHRVQVDRVLLLADFIQRLQQSEQRTQCQQLTLNSVGAAWTAVSWLKCSFKRPSKTIRRPDTPERSR